LSSTLSTGSGSQTVSSDSSYHLCSPDGTSSKTARLTKMVHQDHLPVLSTEHSGQSAPLPSVHL